jgi:hypothetical protein
VHTLLKYEPGAMGYEIFSHWLLFICLILVLVNKIQNANLFLFFMGECHYNVYKYPVPVSFDLVLIFDRPKAHGKQKESARFFF